MKSADHSQNSFYAADRVAGVKAWQARCVAGKRAFQAAHYREAAKEYEAALREAEAFGFRDPRFATTLNSLAGVYVAQGRHQEGEQLYLQALALREAGGGPQNILLAQTLNNLAALYASEQRFQEAEKNYKRALEIAEKTHGSEDLPLAVTLNNLALLYKTQGCFREALPLFQRALRIGLKILGPAHPFIATSLNNFGGICLEEGKPGEAEAFFKQSLAIKEKALGPRHPEVATILNNLADLYCVVGRRREGKPLYERVLEIDEEAWGPSHFEVAADLMQLGSICEAEGNEATAEGYYRRALEIRRSAFGRNHALVAQSLKKLDALSRHGVLGEASADVTNAVDSGKSGVSTRASRLLVITAAEPGLERPAAAQSLCELADRCVHDARWLEAERLYRRELEIEQSIGSPHAPCVGATLSNLGCARRAQGNRPEAARLFQDSLGAWLNSLEPMHPGVPMALNNLATLCVESEKYPQAEALYTKSMEIQKEARGAQDEHVALIAANLASLRHSRVGDLGGDNASAVEGQLC